MKSRHSPFELKKTRDWHSTFEPENHEWQSRPLDEVYPFFSRCNPFESS